MARLAIKRQEKNSYYLWTQGEAQALLQAFRLLEFIDEII